MLINNKNLIKTIKRVDLTNEQETNLIIHLQHYKKMHFYIQEMEMFI